MKKILLALIMATQTLSLWGVASTNVYMTLQALEEPCPPSGHFRVFNGKVIKHSDAERVGGEDGKKALQPISNEMLQAAQMYSVPMMGGATRPPARGEFPDEASYQTALNEGNKQRMEWNTREQKRLEAAKALVVYIKAYNEAWAKVHSGK